MFKKIFFTLSLIAAFSYASAQEFLTEEPDSIHAIYERAVAGSADDQNEVGGWYFRGEHVAQSYPEAVQWWLKGAQGNNFKSTGNLGICYRLGLGIPRDSVRATRLILKSIKDGNSALNDSAIASATRGDVFYNSLLAWKMHTTRGGVEFFPDSAVPYLERAALAGSLDNIRRLALNHYNHRNYEESFRWFSAASQSDSVNSMLYVGRMLLEGKGVEKNEALGFEKVNIAAQAGNRNALYLVGQCYSSGTGVDADPAMALRFYTLASGKGLGKASWDAAKCYLNGIGTEVEYPLASVYFARYASQASADRFRKLITDTIPDSPYIYYLRGQKELNDSNFVSATENFNALAATHPDLGRLMAAYSAINMYNDSDSVAQCMQTIIELTPDIRIGRFILGCLCLETYPDRAEELLAEAGNHGYGTAFSLLGVAYYSGIGFQQNYETAVHWLLRAMELGQLSDEGASALAQCFQDGLGGLSPDPELAAKLREGAYSVDVKKLLNTL